MPRSVRSLRRWQARQVTGCPRWQPRPRSRCRRSCCAARSPQVQQLLNIDGAAVIRIDADGATVILDGAALAEQYGVRL